MNITDGTAINERMYLVDGSITTGKKHIMETYCYRHEYPLFAEYFLYRIHFCRPTYSIHVKNIDCFYVEADITMYWDWYCSVKLLMT